VSPLNVNQRVVWLASVDVRFALYSSIGVVFQQQARIPPLSRRTKEVRAHRPSGCMDINRLGIFDNHPVLRMWMESSSEEDQQCSQGDGSAHQITFSEVSLPRSLEISRDSSKAASRSSKISNWEWFLTPLFLPDRKDSQYLFLLRPDLFLFLTLY